MGPTTKLFMGYGAGCEETTWWAKAMRKIFGHPLCPYFLYKLSLPHVGVQNIKNGIRSRMFT
jgi:hypothetical protein